MEALQWRGVEQAAADRRLAFDHAHLIGQALATLRREVADLVLPAGYLPASFTLGELQQVCERILGHGLDKSSFRRKLADRDVVKPVPGEFRGGANRPAPIWLRSSSKKSCNQ